MDIEKYVLNVNRKKTVGNMTVPDKQYDVDIKKYATFHGKDDYANSTRFESDSFNKYNNIKDKEEIEIEQVLESYIKKPKSE